MTGYSEAVETERRTMKAECEAAAERLHDAGFVTTAQVRDGDAAHQIVACAREREAGLVVVGTRGQTGLRRLILGSVARNVLLHAPCSVLVVHEGARLNGKRLERRTEERESVSAFG